jgi:hypothetical protein
LPWRALDSATEAKTGGRLIRHARPSASHMSCTGTLDGFGHRV